MSFFLKTQRKSLQYCWLALVLLFLGPYFQTKAQSGRRSSKPQTDRSPAAQPVASPNPDVPSLSSSEGLKRSVHLMVGRQSTQRHLQSEDAIFASFVNRLNSFANVMVTPVGEVKRQEAVIQAKNVAEPFMVLLTFEIDSFQNGTIILNSPDLLIEYQILAPRTGKKLTKGKIYFQSIGGGRMRKSDWPGGTPIRITAEATGTQLAEYVHDWLRLEESRQLEQ